MRKLLALTVLALALGGGSSVSAASPPPVFLPIFWLILYWNPNGGVATAMHVGNFSSAANCQAAADAAIGVDTNPGGKVSGFTFVCVQAHDVGTLPPSF
jgi:hypothetical protein